MLPYMAEPNSENPRARFVCRACHARKKACSKTLPTCSFCKARNLQCKYDIPASSKQGCRKYNPGKNFVALQTHSAPRRASVADSGWPERFLPVDSDPKGLLLQGSTAIVSPDRLIYQQVLSLIAYTNRTPESMSEHYFQSFQKEYPVICPAAFRETVSWHLQARDVPPADFSILLLAMCFVTTLPCFGRPLRLSSADRDRLYATTKSLFAQAHAAVTNSLPLVQAMFLISVCEYACVRPQAAHVSINTCYVLLNTLGATNRTSDARNKSPSFETEYMQTEVRKLVSAMATFDRLISIELDLTESALRTGAHSSRPLLPLQLERSYICEITATGDDLLKVQIEILFLLDAILHIAQSVCESTNEKALSELAAADVRLRHYLEMTMSESRKRQISLCTPVALSIRCLFFLHQTILSIHPPDAYDSGQQSGRKSLAVLGTACEMVLDVVHFELDRNTMPITCYYNLCAATVYLREWTNTDDETVSACLDSLRQSQKSYEENCVF